MSSVLRKTVGRLAEEFPHLVAMGVDLPVELVAAEQEARRVVARLTDELAGPGVGQFLEQVDHVGGPLLELLEADAADRVAHPEPPLVPAHEVEDLPRWRGDSTCPRPSSMISRFAVSSK